MVDLASDRGPRALVSLQQRREPTRSGAAVFLEEPDVGSARQVNALCSGHGEQRVRRHAVQSDRGVVGAGKVRKSLRTVEEKDFGSFDPILREQRLEGTTRPDALDSRNEND